ncbi:G-type lectin S-receptor-like serine/threonine-protein kinase [Cardamine amara subsp. amara]|uniref:non-specific serine/threonine protein kinase n=1 Tax=Cardamine amara subsp. amara TaxID=228776 RepID=A0ABD1A8G0_CARAN
MDLNECKRVCLRNCSCSAYSHFDIRDGGKGCILWFGDLIDIREYDENGQDLYVRLASSEIETVQRDIDRASSRKQEEEDFELPFIDLDAIAEATDGFSDGNKLGQGGFGPVYKGTLAGGQEVAVKRLSRTSRQGIEEFKNEIKLIAKLQHRNLVKILGYCVEEDERMLIYEYQPNKSLDFFIFDKERRRELDWPKRVEIIKGIARGLMYLHQDSRLRIIHRDLKASNVLLDSDMNSKISDFGLARTLGGDEIEANTTKVVGTYGYMSPEYQIDGYFSLKSDVFSFGVLVLEIVSGRRNRGFCNEEHKLNLLGHAWKHYTEDKAYVLIDEAFKESCTDISEVLRVIHIGLLCVQQDPKDRPNMSLVVLMLSSEMLLLDPKQPGFFNERNLLFSDTLSINLEIPSNNLETMSVIEPR